MKLIYKIMLSLSIPLFITLGLWGWLSYRTMSERIHKDTDMILKDYSDNIVSRKLSGQEMPDRFNGAYNTYYIREVTEDYAAEHTLPYYGEAEAFIRSQEDFASSRIRRQVFSDREGRYYEIAVSLPTFEQETLVEHVLWWTGILFLVLFVTLLVGGVLVVDYNLKPFSALVRWMDNYVPGYPSDTVPDDTNVLEFKKLADTVRKAVYRFEHEYEERKIFIGNASHELQTPLAVCCNRLEMLLDRPDLNEDIAEEMVKLHRSLQHLIRLNKTLLLLSRIENDQFPPLKKVNMTPVLSDSLALNEEVYSHKSIVSSIEVDGDFICHINEQMASVLVSNLVKNAFVHSKPGSQVRIKISKSDFSVENQGDISLDKTRIFHRFYLPGGRKEGSTGLGLALAYSVCERSNLSLTYDFQENWHKFSVILKK